MIAKGRGTSRPRGDSSRIGATRALTGQIRTSGQTVQLGAALLVQWVSSSACTSAPRRALPG